MIKLIVELFLLLDANEKKRFLMLQILIIIMALLEMISIISIGPFISIVGNMDLIETNKYISTFYNYFEFTSHNNFIICIGYILVFIFALSAIISIFTMWKLSLFASKLGSDLGNRLFQYYLHQNWSFHLENSSVYLTKQIATEATRVTHAVIHPILQINSKIIVILFVGGIVFIYNPIIAFVGIVIFSIAYSIIFILFKNKLNEHGKVISNIMAERFKLLSEGFGLVKDILLMGKQNEFVDKFNDNGDKLAHSQGQNQAIGLVPKFVIEFIAFSFIILFILYLISFDIKKINEVLPMLILYIFVGFKLLPNFQQLYANLSVVKGNMSAFESIKLDLIASNLIKTIDNVNKEKLHLSKEIILQNVSYTYPSKTEPSLSSFNLNILTNKTIGIVGPSGAGKSTLIDILLGQLIPQDGLIKIDNILINKDNIRSWQNNIGFVPQDIFLIDGDIIENIALGVPSKEVNIERIREVIKLVYLEEFISELSEGFMTRIGERGVSLSGGQKQRIAIARALYNNPEILIFDEATSALDGITEKYIMDAINNLQGTKTIILIAHRIKTVQKCDLIYILDKGHIVDKGTYSELLNKNDMFRNMVEHS